MIVEDLIGQNLSGASGGAMAQPQYDGGSATIASGAGSEFNPEMQEKMMRLSATASYLYNLKEMQSGGGVEQEQRRTASPTSGYLDQL